MASDNKWLKSLKLNLAYWAGRAVLQTRGVGAIVRLSRVRPRQRAPFQPLQASEITPQFLDQALRALKSWNYDIVGIDEVCRRAVTMPEERRFVCLTFDGASRDVINEAYPVLARHGVPFTVYVPTAFPDGLGQAWWLALEQIIARESRLSLMIARDDRHFTLQTTAEKYELYAFLSSWLRSLEPSDLSVAINDLCKRYSVDLAALSREAFMDWTDLARLAADPSVTIGSATVNYPVLASLKDAAAWREMTMGRAVGETALHRQIRHFAYPFGDCESFRRAHLVMAEEAGFQSAVSTLPGIVEAAGRTPLFELPRIDWDGRLQSLRALRVLVSGATFAALKPARSDFYSIDSINL